MELIAGDLLSRKDCEKAAEGASIIYHLAAGFDKSFAGAFMTLALGTRNLLDAFRRVGKPKTIRGCQFLPCLYESEFEARRHT